MICLVHVFPLKSHKFHYIFSKLKPFYSLASSCRNFTISPKSDHIPSELNNNSDFIITQLQSCTNLQELNQIHACMIRSHVLEMHPTSFHWNSLMRPYARLSLPTMALRVYLHMSRFGVPPDCYTLPLALKAVTQIFADKGSRQFHAVAVRNGFDLNEFCESGLISMYAKAGEFENALKVFEQNPHRKLGSWNAIIGGFAQGGRSREAIYFFIEMQRLGYRPDGVTMVSVASSCGSLGELDLAAQIHKCAYHVKFLAKSEIKLSNSLVDMYGKCGRMDLAYRVFERMEQRDVSTWTSMIVGLAMHGKVNDAFAFFDRMTSSGIRPNHVTFVGVLSACVHGGLVEEGQCHFNSMIQEYGIVPIMAHYGCMVDLFARVGRLEDAKEMVEAMPMRANSVIWGTLIGACEKHGSVELGEWAARNLLELDPGNDGVYVVLSNIYARAGRWDEVERMRGLMKKRDVAKTPGYSLTTTSG